MASYFVFIGFVSKIVFKQKRITLKLTVLPQTKSMESQNISFTSLGFRLRHDYRFQHFISYLHAAYDSLLSERNSTLSDVSKCNF